MQFRIQIFIKLSQSCVSNASMTREHSDARAVPHRSAKGQVWRLQGHAERDMQAGELHASLADLPLPDARQLLSQKGVEGEAQQRWLEPVHLQDGLQHLMPELMRLKDLEKAATRIADAIEQGEEVGLSGDYDCDGNSSVALLRRLLLQSGVPEARIHTHVPNRVSDGYGVNRNAVEAMDGKQVSLLITLDNGTLAYEPIRTAAARGMDTVVIDHHPNSADQFRG